MYRQYIKTVCGTCLFALILSSCFHHVSVEPINRDPGRFHDNEITAAGRVVNSFALSDAGAFELDDGTGRLWVWRDSHNMPGHNSSVTVTGKIEQGFSFGGRNFVIILRETRTPR